MCDSDLLMMSAEEAGKPMLTRINLATCDMHTEAIGGQLDAPSDEGRKPGDGGGSAAKSEPALAGLPTGMPGRDAGKPMDPAKVAEQAQHLSLPAKIALPAVLSNSRNQERTSAETESD